MTRVEDREEHAVVLRTDAYGEADRIVTLFCAHGGKLRAIARGARRSQKRFASLQPSLRGRVHLQRRAAPALHVLESFAVDDEQLGLLADLGRLSHAAYFCELTDLLSAPEASEPRLYALLAGVLAELHAQPASVERLRRFEARALAILGFLPAIDACVQCSKKIAEAAGWRDSGLLCDECAPDPRRFSLAPLWMLFDEPARDAGPELARLRPMLQSWLRGPLDGRALRTIAFIEEINR